MKQALTYISLSALCLGVLACARGRRAVAALETEDTLGTQETSSAKGSTDTLVAEHRWSDSSAEKSIQVFASGRVAYEFRTPLHPEKVRGTLSKAIDPQQIELLRRLRAQENSTLTRGPAATDSNNSQSALALRLAAYAEQIPYFNPLAKRLSSGGPPQNRYMKSTTVYGDGHVEYEIQQGSAAGSKEKRGLLGQMDTESLERLQANLAQLPSNYVIFSALDAVPCQDPNAPNMSLSLFRDTKKIVLKSSEKCILTQGNLSEFADAVEQILSTYESQIPAL